MQSFSGLKLLLRGLTGQRGWTAQWRSPEPRAEYDALIVGGGGHGLGAAYYLAREHHLTNIAVLEKGWIGGGNTGRNTTIIRSNYLSDESAALYDHAVRLWEHLSQVLNYNMMFSQRGVMMLAHTVHDAQVFKRHVHANRVNGVDNEWLTPEEAKAFCPLLNIGNIRYPVLGAALQRRGGTARHDAVAWGYARAADALGVDIIQNCEVSGFLSGAGGRVVGVETSRGRIRAERIGIAAAGHSSVLAKLAGFRLPVVSYALQAMVTEPLKPALDTVVSSPGTGAYVSQSDKGEMVIGASLDLFPSYAQRGSFAVLQGVIAATLALFPSFSRLRLLRQWAGIVDVVHDSSPIIGPTPVPGLYINCGWGTGGFKAIPAGGWTLAHVLATGRNHELAEPFQLERFITGRLIDEAAAAGIAH